MLRTQERDSSEAGFGLPTTIIFLIIFSIITLVGVSLARQEVRTQVRVTSRKTAFYAAESGLGEGLRNWRTPPGLIPTDTSWDLAAGTLPGGGAYSVSASRLDAGSAEHAFYSIKSEGRAKDGTTQHVGLLILTRVLENPISSALQVIDSAKLAGTADVVGLDTIPPSWYGSYCSVNDDDKPGVSLPDPAKYEQKGGAKVKGDPDIYVDSDTTGFFDFGSITYDEMAAAADHKLPGGTIMDGTNPSPSLNADGTCNTSDPMNWGSPMTVGLPCSDWFPIIHVTGDLLLQATQRGQGILLVDGNLTAKGGFQFFGPVIVKGSLIAEGGFTFYGGVRARTTDLGAGNAEIYYSACVLERAISNTMAARPQRLMERPWYRNR
jgi:type II secretory pathway pseudopilin PulG